MLAALPDSMSPLLPAAEKERNKKMLIEPKLELVCFFQLDRFLSLFESKWLAV
jgi:hypothetical protein